MNVGRLSSLWVPQLSAKQQPLRDPAGAAHAAWLPETFPLPSLLPPGYNRGMEPTKLCPMCGGTTATDSKRCLSCGESFAPSEPNQTLLQARVTPGGILPSAIAGTVAGPFVILIMFICEHTSRPNAEFELGGIVIAIFVSLIIGAVVGSTAGAIRRVVRSTHPDSSRP